MRTITPHRAATLAIAVIASFAAGCGATSSDKAGGTRIGKPVVLTMANGNGDDAELDPFASAVSQMSNGTLRIVFHNHWRTGSPGYETGVIHDVAAGKADLGWAGSRAFDSVGVASFDALNAPLLIDSYPLQRTALESPLASQMLDALKPLGVVGLGILPGPLRKPLGSSRLVGPQDYRGKKIAIQDSQIARATLRALGATAHAIPSGGRIDAFDGIEQQIGSIDGNRYDSVGKYLTANVNLWPRPLVLFMNTKAFAALTDVQRRVLRRAARNALSATLRIQTDRQHNESLGNLCRRRVSFVTASDIDLAALRRAVQPVYDKLQQDPQNKAAIEQIRAMRSALAAKPDAPMCATAASAASGAHKATGIDGVYRTHTSASELRDAGAAADEVNPSNYGDYEMVLDRGRFTQDQPDGNFGKGTYAIHGDTFTMTFESGSGPNPNKPGEQFTYRWSLYRDELTLFAVKGKVSPAPLLAKPWRRIRNAP